MTEPRQTCARCLRPAAVCVCAQLPRLSPKTRVVLLQHPREARVPIGTARLASLCLEGAQLFVGLDFASDERLPRVLADPERPAALLFPGEGAVDLATRRDRGPITLVVVDGTWSQAQKVIKRNPAIAALPRYSLQAGGSEYGLRRAPREGYVATLEAIALALGVLEGDAMREALLGPLRRMVALQHEHKARLNGGLERHQRRWSAKPEKPPRIPSELSERVADLVCVAGEVNAWNAKLPGAYPTELVQWLAFRVATGERFEAVVAPTHPLAPSTPFHTALEAETILSGIPFPQFLERWRAFSRESDVLCSWGTFAIRVALAAGTPLPKQRLDLRKITGDLLQISPGTIEASLARWRLDASPLGSGRGGLKLGQVLAATRHLASQRRPPRGGPRP